MMVTRSQLDSILLNNVCEVRFKRRVSVDGRPPSRRMLCTNSYKLLNSTNGKVTLNFKPPKGGMQVNEAKNNVIVTWDILMQSFRTINADQVDLINQWPADDTYWEHFNENVYPMSSEQKLAFMNS